MTVSANRGLSATRVVCGGASVESVLSRGRIYLVRVRCVHVYVCDVYALYMGGVCTRVCMFKYMCAL